MGLWSWFKSLTVVHILLGYIFLASGFLVSFLMMLGMVIWPFSKSLYRKFVFCLSYALWSEFSFLAHWWVNADCDLYISAEDQQILGKEHCNTKIYGKNILKYVPVIGWTWYFTESIFLKRSWEEDKKILEKSIKELVTFPGPFWVTLLLFPEGTRWTPDKHKVCQDIAKAKGYPEYKHMLLPRTKGFFLSMQLMKGKIPTVLDCTVGFPEPEPTLWDAISGKKICCALIARRYKIVNIPTTSEEECGKWLRDLYKQKDEELDYYKKTGKFQGLPTIDVPRRYYDLFWFIFWTVLTLTPLCYYLMYLVFSASIIHKVTVLVVVSAAVVLMKWMISFSEVKHGTSYGLSTEKKESKKSQ